MKTKILFFSLLSFLILNSACEKTEESASQTGVTTKDVTDIGLNEALCGGTITDTSEIIISCGVCWDTQEDPTVSKNKTIDKIINGSFKSYISGLTENTTYYIKAYIETKEGVNYGQQISIKTLLKDSLPQINTSDITYIQHVMALGGGEVVSDGGNPVIERGLCWSTKPSPTIIDTFSYVYAPKIYSAAGAGLGSFSGKIINLLPKTKYYVRAYATTKNGTSYGNETLFVSKDINYGTVTDVEGNTYKTIEIGNKVWMAENLKTTKLNDNTPITYVTNQKDWELMSSPSYCWYNLDIQNKDIYGGLYAWYTVDSKKLCPTNWHVSTKTDWDSLINVLGDSTNAGIALKEAGKVHWKEAQVPFNNASGFTVLPGGHRYRYGLFDLLEHKANFWLQNEASSAEGWYKDMNENGGEVGTWRQNKNVGYSVRCVKD